MRVVQTLEDCTPRGRNVQTMRRSGCFVTSFRSLAPRLFLAYVAILAMWVPGLATTEQVFEKTYPLQPGGHFALDNVNGSVQVEGWDRQEVEVTAVKTAQNDPRDVDRVQ